MDSQAGDVPPSFKPFCLEGRVAVSNSCSRSIPIIILRNTVSDLSCILKKAVPTFHCYTDEHIIVSGLPGAARYPLCTVYLDCTFSSGRAGPSRCKNPSYCHLVQSNK